MPEASLCEKNGRVVSFAKATVTEGRMERWYDENIDGNLKESDVRVRRVLRQRLRPPVEALAEEQGSPVRVE